MNKSLIIAVVALVVSVVGVVLPQSKETVVNTLAGVSGTEHTSFEQFHGGLADGGDIFATSTPTNSTIKAVDLMRSKQIDMTLTTGDGTLTLPATSTLAGWLPSPGDTRTILIRNATTSATVNLTVAAGTGMTLKNSASSTASLIGDTDGKNTMFVTLVRQSSSNFNVFLTRFHD